MRIIFHFFWILATACVALGSAQQVQSGGEHPILRGSPEMLRITARTAPLPTYPKDLIDRKQSGLVVVEVTVNADGRVSRVSELESFAPAAAKAVQDALRRWVFYTEEDMIAVGLLKFCDGCVRINRLTFAFRLADGRSWVEDLAHQELIRRREPNPFIKLPKH